MKPGVLGLGWYDREDYPRILEIMIDASQLQQAYNDWLGRTRILR